MDIEINYTRGHSDGIECANWDPDFMEKIFAWLNKQPEGTRPGAGFHILSHGHRALVKAVEEILGEHQEELTITVRVKGKPTRV